MGEVPTGEGEVRTNKDSGVRQTLEEVEEEEDLTREEEGEGEITR
jgi:hypothetical protein